MDQVYVARHKVLVEGISARRLARELGISRRTVKRYIEGGADAKAVAAALGVEVRMVWTWVRAGRIVARRLPGERGRVRVALEAEGFAVSAERRPRSTPRDLASP